MVNKADTNKARLNRHRRVRGKVTGTAERPRLNVFRSAKNIYAQIIDDVAELLSRQLPRWTKSLLAMAETRKPQKRLAS